MSKFPVTDKGSFGRLARVQNMAIIIQRGFVAAKDQVRKLVEHIIRVTSITTSIDTLRDNKMTT